MLQVSPRQIFLGLCAVTLAAAIFLTKPEPAKAGWLDSIFGNNDEVGNLIQAGDTATLGTGNRDETVDGVFGGTVTSAFVRLAGPDAANIPEEQKAAAYKRYGRGAIADVASTIPYFFQPPATTQTFVADLLDSARIVPRAQAQGLGFAALDPILSTWKMFRNLAYLLYVVIFMVIGLMVMFKTQMGKAAVTLQSAIPNIIISLIFVTFSYAIAGFLIDIMYVLMYLLVGMFPAADSNKIMDYNFLQLGWTIIMGNGQTSGAFKSFADAVDGFVSQAVDFSGTDDNNTWYGAISGITMSLIMSVAILIGVFKLFFELLKTYVTIVLLIAFSPLLLMIGAIPGQDVFQGWLRDVFGNLMAFPTTLLIIIVFRMFTAENNIITGNSEIVAGGFLPPFLIGRGSAGALTTLVGIGIVLIMPELIQQMKKALGVKEGLFTVLAKDMAKNFQEGSYYGSMPTAAVASSLGGAAKGAKNYILDTNKFTGTGKFDMAGLRAAALHGNPIVKDNNVVGYDGGLKQGFFNTAKVAKSMSTGINRVASGNFKAPESKEKEKEGTDMNQIARQEAPSGVNIDKGAL